MAFPLKDIRDTALYGLRASVSARLESLRSYRTTWWVHWGQLAEVFLPRRYRWLTTPNNWSRGSAINGNIIDETGVLAARTLATGLLANLTSPTKPWLKLGIAGLDTPETGPVAEYLAECTKRLLAVYAQSNIYTALGTAYHDNAVFGSAALIQYEDDEDIVRFYNPCLGEFFFGLSKRLTVDTLYREYTYTVKETVDEFGIDNVSTSVATMYRSASNLDTEVTICHAIEPNDPVYSSGEYVGLPIPALFPYREVYWERASAQGTGRESVLRVAGFREKPFVGLRWDVTSNDAYGRSPGMDAMPATRQLQVQQRRLAEAIDKLVRPPMVGSVSMRNEPASILPGGITYVADPAGAGFKAAFTVDPRVQEMEGSINVTQMRVKEILFNNLFTGISDLETVRTATEIDARIAEKLILLGPVVERTENEGLDDIVYRTFSIMQRRGMFPEAPPEIANHAIKVTYISILAEYQRAASTAAIERTAAFAGSFVAVKPDALDTIRSDDMIREYAELLNLNPALMASLDEVAAVRAQRDKAIAAQAALQTGAAMAQGAKTLSETDIGGGQNALESMMQ